MANPSYFVHVPLRQTYDTNVQLALQTVISSTISKKYISKYQSRLDEVISKIVKLRSTACTVKDVAQNNETTATNELEQYHDELYAIESTHMNVKISFTWTEVFAPRNFLGAAKYLTVESVNFEKVSVLFNIGAMKSQVAARTLAAGGLSNDERLKLAAKLYQSSAGLFKELRTQLKPIVGPGGSNLDSESIDFKEETLNALSIIMLAAGQECIVYKAIHDGMKDLIIAKIAARCSEMFKECVTTIKQVGSKISWPDSLKKTTLQAKSDAMMAIAEYHQSVSVGAAKKIGEQIARLQVVVSKLKNVKGHVDCSEATEIIEDYLSKASKTLESVEKDNNFIYHEVVPAYEKLNPIEAIQPLAKPVPMPFSGRLQPDFYGPVDELIDLLNEIKKEMEAEKEHKDCIIQ